MPLAHSRLYDLAGAVDKLPNLVPESTPNGDKNTAEIPLRMTGSDGPIAKKCAVPDAVTGDIERHRTAPMYTFGIVGGASEDSSQPVETQQPGASRHRVASYSNKIGDLGFEPRLTESESVVLPLHQSPK